MIKLKAYWFALKIIFKTAPIAFKIHYSNYILSKTKKWIVPKHKINFKDLEF